MILIVCRNSTGQPYEISKVDDARIGLFNTQQPLRTSKLGIR